MADAKIAIDFVLKQEDARMSGQVTDIQNDNGGRTRWGIAESAHPELTPSGFYGSMPNDASLAVAESVYTRAYAAHIWINSIRDQRVANALMSFAVNLGPATAIKLIQRTVGVPDDGVMGPGTMSAINAHDTGMLLSDLGVVADNHYDDIVAAHPEQVKFIRGWRNRVIANITQS